MQTVYLKSPGKQKCDASGQIFIYVVGMHNNRNAIHENNLQVGQLSQTNRTAGRVSFGNTCTNCAPNNVGTTRSSDLSTWYPSIFIKMSAV